MAVESQVFKVIGLGNDSATSFSFSPMVLPDDSSQLVVIKTSAAGVETTLVEENTSTGYAVVVSSFPGTGSVTYPASGGTPLATGETITMKRVLTLEQALDLFNQGAWQPETQELQFDRLVMIDLQQQEILDRAFSFPVSYNGGASAEIPTPEAGSALVWNAAGTALTNATDVGDTLFTLPSSTTDHAVIRWDGTLGTSALDSGVIVDDSDNVSGIGTLDTTGTVTGGADIVATTDVTVGEDLVEPDWVDLASATSTAIGGAAGRKVNITGTTTITSFDTVAAGIVRHVKFAGILTLTHNGTSLILPGGANIATAAGDTATFVSEGSGNWRCTAYLPASGEAVIATAPAVIQKQRFLASGTWNKPSSGTYALVECWGAGGSGAARAGNSPGGGGAGGAYHAKVFLLSALGSSETVTIGSGGAAVTSSAGGNAGNVGGNTTFGSHLTAYGGGGGGSQGGAGGGGGATSAGATGSTNAGGAGGGPHGGAGSASATAGNDSIAGGAGGPGNTATTPGSAVSGGGSGGAGASGASAGDLDGGNSVHGGAGGGGADIAGTPGAGGTSLFGGNGGAGNNNGGGVGVDGVQPGGGGGASYDSNSGAGADGAVQVTVY